MPTLVASDPPNRVEILGVPVDRIDMDEAMARIREFVESGESHIVVTADAAGLAQAMEDAEYKEILRNASLITPDSSGVLWAAKRLGKPIKERVSGVDLVGRICEESARTGWRIYLLGSEPGVAELAGERLSLAFPGANIVGTHHGYFKASEDEAVAAKVADAKPDVLFVAMGIPRQEKFISKTRGIIRARVAIGVGGSLDVYSGRAKRAPKLLQKMRLEWLWRLLLKPSKISKAKYLPRFVSHVLRQSR